MNKHDEEFGKWLIAGNSDDDEEKLYGNSWDIPNLPDLKYVKMAKRMQNCIHVINLNRSYTERVNAASDLRRLLEDCAIDENLSDLTANYRDKKENNIIGYNAKAASDFVAKMGNRYPIK